MSHLHKNDKSRGFANSFQPLIFRVERFFFLSETRWISFVDISDFSVLTCQKLSG